MSSETPFEDAKALLLAANLDYPIAWPNERFRVPVPPAPWLAVQSSSGVLAPVDIGANVWQEEGTLYVDVNVPAGSGTTLARQVAKDVANVFRALGPRDVRYLGGSISNGQIGTEDGIWWTITVSVDWQYDDVIA